MNHHALSVYLRDHLAGSEIARAMLGRVVEGSDGAFFAALDQEIAEDQAVLEGLIKRLGSEESLAKKAAAWMSEKLTRLKLSDPEKPLERFEFLEVLLLGVRGKQALWEALDAGLNPDLKTAVDLPRLIARAKSQLERIESRRLQAFVDFSASTD